MTRAGARPRALDLFCGVGGASMGLYRAGFDVIGLDCRRQRRYPFPFVCADSLKPPFDLSQFDLIWASPPCQDSSILRQLPWLRDRQYPQLIPQTRALLLLSGRPFVIENVIGAPLRRDLVLCGTQFGLPCYRHRALGIDWASSRAQLAQAIPPAYSEFIGRAAMRYLARTEAA